MNNPSLSSCFIEFWNVESTALLMLRTRSSSPVLEQTFSITPSWNANLKGSASSFCLSSLLCGEALSFSTSDTPRSYKQPKKSAFTSMFAPSLGADQISCTDTTGYSCFVPRQTTIICHIHLF